jgi:hypothetical protein
MSKIDVIEALYNMRMDLINMSAVTPGTLGPIDDNDGLSVDEKMALNRLSQQLTIILNKIQSSA